MQGMAKYNGENVVIIDIVVNPFSNEREYMINYNGPIWVKEYDLYNIVYGAN